MCAVMLLNWILLNRTIKPQFLPPLFSIEKDLSKTEVLSIVPNVLVIERPVTKSAMNNSHLIKYFSVRTDLLANGAQSRLHIAGATFSDSGNYTCMMGRTAKTQIELQIIPGNFSAVKFKR